MLGSVGGDGPVRDPRPGSSRSVVGGGQTDRERECVQCEVNTPRLEGFASGVLGEGVLGRGPEGNRQSLGRGGWSWGKGHVKRGQRST